MDEKTEYLTALALASAQIVAAAHAGADLTPHVDTAMSLTPPAGINRWDALLRVIALQAAPETNLEDRLDWVRGFDPLIVAVCNGEAA